MSWTCQCSAAQPDDGRFCELCGRPKQASPSPTTNPNHSHIWKLGAIAAVLIGGVIFGTLVAVTTFGNRGGETNAPVTAKADARSAYQQAFETSFKVSCRQAAMRSGNLSRTSADNYCDCALPVFNQTHDMTKVVASCKQYAMR